MILYSCKGGCEINVFFSEGSYMSSLKLEFLLLMNKKY